MLRDLHSLSSRGHHIILLSARSDPIYFFYVPMHNAMTSLTLFLTMVCLVSWLNSHSIAGLPYSQKHLIPICNLSKYALSLDSSRKRSKLRSVSARLTCQQLFYCKAIKVDTIFTLVFYVKRNIRGLYTESYGQHKTIRFIKSRIE